MPQTKYVKGMALILAWVVSGLAAVVAAPATRAGATTPPNIVLLYSDDIGYGDVGCYGATKVSTPNIDRLAAAGRRFTDAHSSASTCTPSRYSLLTGEYSFRNRQAAILPGDAPLIIRPGTVTLPELLRRAGYATACVGKWHLGLGAGAIDWNGKIAPGPLDIGFDYSFIIPATPDRVPCTYVEGDHVLGLIPADPLTVSYEHRIGSDPTGHDHPEMLRYPANPQHSGTIVDHISRIGWMAGGHSAWWKDEEMARTLLQKAQQFLEQNRSRPLFLYYAMHNIHVPRAPNEAFIGKSQCGLRGDSIEELDWSVGQLMQTLDRLGLTQNTLVIFSSDNGPIFNDGYADGAVQEANGHKPAGPFRGGKYQIYEGGTRLPFITCWPGHVRPGESAALMCHVDCFASLAHLAGATAPAASGPDSVDLLPALLGESPKGREVLVEQSEQVLALRSGNWKFIPPGQRRKPQEKEEGDATTGPALSPAGQLYDLAADPGETKNFAHEHPDIVRDLAAKLRPLTDEPHAQGF